MTTIEKEKRAYLRKELKEYEKAITMTEEERNALHEWVQAGNSVHENGSYACYEGGAPVDFLDVYREEEEIRQKLNSLSGEEKERYLCELRGEPYLPDLITEKSELELKLKAYASVLEIHNLKEHADEVYEEMRNPKFMRDLPDDMELPFP